MDQRIESFLATFSRSRVKTRTRSGKACASPSPTCQALCRVREPNKRMRDKAALACRALCRARVTDELQRRRGTQIAEHLKFVRNVIDRQVHERALLKPASRLFSFLPLHGR
jgi:hypothetical protein